MNCTTVFYPEARFGGFTDVDGTVAFYSRVNALLDPTFVVLDVGCGRGSHAEDPIRFRRELRTLKGKAARVIGIDVDRGASENPFLDEFRFLEGDAWPIADNAVDLIVCDNVLEHIANPERFFDEVRRTLKDGGYLCIRTPNRWSYVALAAALIPNRYHAKVTSMVQNGRKAEDVFPTYYRCNSTWQLQRLMSKAEITGVAYGYEAEPSYLSFSTIAYFCGVLHQRCAPGCVRPAIFAFGRLQKTVPLH